jgi:hypothetical protein
MQAEEGLVAEGVVCIGKDEGAQAHLVVAVVVGRMQEEVPMYSTRALVELVAVAAAVVGKRTAAVEDTHSQVAHRQVACIGSIHRRLVWAVAVASEVAVEVALAVEAEVVVSERFEYPSETEVWELQASREALFWDFL